MFNNPFSFKYLDRATTKELVQKISEYLIRRFNELSRRNGTMDNRDESLPEIDWNNHNKNVELLLARVKNKRKEDQIRKEVW